MLLRIYERVKYKPARVVLASANAGTVPFSRAHQHLGDGSDRRCLILADAGLPYDLDDRLDLARRDEVTTIPD